MDRDESHINKIYDLVTWSRYLELKIASRLLKSSITVNGYPVVHIEHFAYNGLNSKGNIKLAEVNANHYMALISLD